MKIIATILTLLLLPALLQAAEIKFGDNIVPRKPDLRLVGTTTVDVGPVHAWLQDTQGDRPLKHWKQLQVFNIKANVSTMVQCVVKTEEGKFEEILVKNFPARISEFIATFASEAIAITNLQTELATHMEGARRAKSITPAENQDLEQYLEEVLTGNAVANLEEAAIQEKSEALQKLLRNHEATRARAVEATSLVAMNTMRKFTNLPVWDCGLQK
ncbi:MAG TPA: hypothetical protein VK633_09295 [Verrucomicrobiae bacterium]|nr:hypothetical protein [Verrucomicrobiae bacterium]